MNILLTGASGFLGSTLIESLKEGVTVETIGRRPLETGSQHYTCDLSSEIPELNPKNDYSKVIHFAGKAHSIPKTEAEKEVFWKVNLQGTLNLLAALNELDKKPETFYLSSTVAVYGLDKGSNIKEDNNLNPQTPYGQSKLDAEKAVQKWCAQNGVQYLILRLPLIAGKQPPGNLGSMKIAIKNGRYPRIGKNQAKKSMVLAEDIAQLIVTHTSGSGIYNLTDGTHPSFYEIEQAIEKRVKRKIKIKIPLFVLRPFALVGDVIEKITQKPFPLSSLRLNKLTESLTFDDSKARRELGWNPRPVLPFIEKYL